MAELPDTEGFAAASKHVSPEMVAEQVSCGRSTERHLQAIHRYVVETPVLKTVTEEIRAVVETVWPELISKLPPKP